MSEAAKDTSTTVSPALDIWRGCKTGVDTWSLSSVSGRAPELLLLQQNSTAREHIRQLISTAKPACRCTDAIAQADKAATSSPTPVFGSSSTFGAGSGFSGFKVQSRASCSMHS